MLRGGGVKGARHPKAPTQHRAAVEQSRPITLLEYRYGGFGWRATEEWKRDNSSMLTSEGLPRAQSDGSLACWRLRHVPTRQSHPPQTPPHLARPRQRRTSLLQLLPHQKRPWPLVPAQTYTPKYRMLIANFPLDAPTAEAAWQAYAHP